MLNNWEDPFAQFDNTTETALNNAVDGTIDNMANNNVTNTVTEPVEQDPVMQTRERIHDAIAQDETVKNTTPTQVMVSFQMSN